MSRGGGLLAALLGAGGASAYYTGDALGPLRHIPGLGNLGTGFGQTSSYGGGGSNREMDDLKRLVEQLSRDFGRNQGFTIVTNPGGKGGSSAFAVVAVITSAGVVYLRFWRGWRFSDMMYVTRSSLTKSISQVSAGMESVKQALQQRVDLVKSKLGGQLDELRAESKEAQEAMAEAQGAMADHLRLVGDDVQGVQTSVQELEANLDEISLHQRTANEGIHLLCSVVGDLMKKTGYRMASVVEPGQVCQAAANDRLAPCAGVGGPSQHSRGVSRPLADMARVSTQLWHRSHAQQKCTASHRARLAPNITANFPTASLAAART
ncbi:hypothetical protein WJX73_004801 [Symbiochloris irregularis]|uniref:DUF1664 domain-containing protein n=1 Tax=Symbiochloris irregularis TaxID=706552 RepID=A0AAW1NZT7_9CHLO